MTATTRPRELADDEQQILNVDTTCPGCGVPALYVWGLDRYFHLDGSDNTLCWWSALRGVLSADAARREVPVYIHRVHE